MDNHNNNHCPTDISENLADISLSYSSDDELEKEDTEKHFTYGTLSNAFCRKIIKSMRSRYIE